MDKNKFNFKRGMEDNINTNPSNTVVNSNDLDDSMNDRIHEALRESISRLIIESFESSKIRNFFKQHGGLNRKFRNFSAGDITDEQINFWKEYPSYNEAIYAMHNLKRPDARGRRNDLDMASHLNILAANDGTTAIAGVIRGSVDLGSTWGGEYQKKVADRLNNNGWNFKTRDNRYVDDSDTYYYGGDKNMPHVNPANDFGMWTNRDYKNKKSMVDKYKGEMSNDSFNKWRDSEHKHLQDYMRRNHPDKYNK